MAHDYFCTHCGRQLKQEIVLFDMQYVLTGKEKFETLSFRLTKSELDALSAKAKLIDLNYRSYELSFGEFLGYVCNERNLRDPAIANLTMEMIQDFLDKMKEEEYGQQEEAPAQSAEQDIFALFDAPAAAESALTAEPETDNKAELERWPEPIRALMVRDASNTDYGATKKLMRRDFDTLKKLFATGSYRIEFFLTELDDDLGGKVLSGYMARVGVGEKRKIVTIQDGRVCCHCGNTVFRYAGTAKHRTVALIGTQSSGKTSTILALAHYAQNALRNVFSSDPIWGKTKPIPSVLNIELLSPDQRLRDDLARYERGIAPPKTSASRRGDAYSATFRIQNSTDPSKYYIITLTDLPGELCSIENATIDRNNIMNEFQVALACEMFLLCFDAAATTGANAMKITHAVCNWANEFQDLRTWFWKNAVDGRQQAAGIEGCYAPVMILYTKCAELEEPEKNGRSGRRVSNPDPIYESYVFNKERVEIKENEIYEHAGKEFRNFDRLANTYMSRLRCSPYGYEAPGEEKVHDGAPYHTPTPIHVDDLMRWILAVNGCIDTGAVYYPDHSDHNTRFTQRDNLLTQPQYRKQKPGTNLRGTDADLHEALARCYLFENPGAIDTNLVQNYDNKWGLMQARTMARIRENS